MTEDMESYGDDEELIDNLYTATTSYILAGHNGPISSNTLNACMQARNEAWDALRARMRDLRSGSKPSAEG